MADDSHEHHHNIPDDSIVLEFVVPKGKLSKPQRMQLLRESGWRESDNVQLSVCEDHDPEREAHYTYLFLPGTAAIAKKFATKVKSRGIKCHATQYRGGRERPYLMR